MRLNATLRQTRAKIGVCAVIFSGVLGALTGGVSAENTAAEAQESQRTTQNQIFFKIGTGPIGGTYFPVGDMIGAIISHPEGSVRCETVERCGPKGLIAVATATEGSVQNVQDVESGQVESALAQANVVEAAFSGTGRFKRLSAHGNLRVIGNLYLESVHLVASTESGISNLRDLRGKRVSIGRKGSGSHTNATQILAAVRLGRRSVKLQEISLDQAAEALLEGELDAFFFTGGAPVPVIQELAETGKVVLVPVDGDAIDRLRTRARFFVGTTIPEGTYPNLQTVRTLGVGALWIAHQSMDPDLIYMITRALWHPDNKQILIEGHPAGQFMGAESAVGGIPIPLHPGAERYYREIGLLKAAEPDKPADEKKP